MSCRDQKQEASCPLRNHSRGIRNIGPIAIRRQRRTDRRRVAIRTKGKNSRKKWRSKKPKKAHQTKPRLRPWSHRNKTKINKEMDARGKKLNCNSKQKEHKESWSNRWIREVDEIRSHQNDSITRNKIKSKHKRVKKTIHMVLQWRRRQNKRILLHTRSSTSHT